jgi:hypothetical protein
MPLVSHGLFLNLGVDWGCTLLGCISILFIPIPFVLYKVSFDGGFSGNIELKTFLLL